MSKVEDLANEIYKGDTPITRLRRKDYCDGYHQAEKNLELTWEDINTIIGLYNDLDDKALCNPKRACKEILKQFKERKEL